MSSKDEEARIKTHWRFTDAKLSPAWLRLVRKLTASREGKPASTPPDAGEDEKEPD